MSGLYSCSKDKSKKMDFAFNQQKDTTFNYQKLSKSINVAFTSGDKTNINLSVSGLPKGLDAQFSIKSGTPDFSSILEFTHNDFIIAGTYPIKIIGTADDGTEKSADFKLSINASCGEFASGNYTTEVTYTSSGESLNNTQYRLATKPENPNRIYFYEGKNTKADFYADVDCTTSTISIPTQTQNGSSLQFSGSGKMMNKTKQLEFTITYVGFTELKFAMTKQ